MASLRTSLTQSIGIIALAVLAFGWAELYLPLRESVGIDVFRLAGQLRNSRADIQERLDNLPRLRVEIDEAKAAVAGLASKFASAFSDELYVAISAAANRLYLRRGRDVVLDAEISSGCDDTLKAEGGRKWIFETPRGVMTVWRKKDKPIWIKPDWAFLEAGETIPPMDSPLRKQEGVLGDYLLDLGGGVAIHGTPYENLLGRSVTHGCIRIGRKDLKVLWDSVPVGTRVYIY